MSTASAPLELGSDLALRYRYFTKASLAHPAKLHLGLLQWILGRYTLPGDTIADPMCGVGSTAYAALLQRNVILREIEPKWLAFAHENAAIIVREAGMFAGAIDLGQADARQPWGFQADHILFSPPYGVSFSGKENSKGMLSHRQKYLQANGAPLSERWKFLFETDQPGAAGAYRFFYGDSPNQIGHWRGDRYWEAMEAVYTQARNALRGHGTMILVIKDHIRHGARVCVADQTVALCESLGFQLAARHARRVYPLSLWQRRRKEKGEPITEDEDVLVFARGEEQPDG
jgi:predicted RNA methylase